MFELRFLGTGAADIDFEMQAPTDFDNKDFRRCSCALVNGHILLDCGPFALNSLSIIGVPTENITDIIVTHLHPDHFYPSVIEKIALSKSDKLQVWLRADAEFAEIPNCEFHRMNNFSEYRVSELAVTGIPANHTMYPQHLVIRTENKKLLYATDGGWMLNSSVAYLKSMLFDTVIIDCTVGDCSGDYRMAEHNSIPMLRIMYPSMKTLGIIDDKSSFILTHLAMSLNKSYAETVSAVSPDGFIVAYDGMKINI